MFFLVEHVRFERRVCSEFDDQAFASGDGVGEDFAGAFFFLAHHGIGLARIVVMQDQLLDVGGMGEFASGDKRCMSPSSLWSTTDLARIFFGGVHRVENEDVGTLGEATQFRIDDGVVLGVGDIHDRLALVVDAIGIHTVGVISSRIRDPNILVFPDGNYFAFVKVTERHLRAHLGEVHREARVVHLARERFLERARDIVTTKKMDDVLADKRRCKERKALDVVPVHVTEKQPCFDGHLGEQTLAQKAQSCASIQNDQCVAGPNFIAAGIAAILNRIGSGRGDASSDTPHL